MSDRSPWRRSMRDISSDPVRAVVDAARAWSKSNPPERARLDFVLRGKIADLEASERDISSDPVPHVHKPEYPSTCTGCEHLGWKDRDISSVTGSLDDLWEQYDTELTSDCEGRNAAVDTRPYRTAIQREAVEEWRKAVRAYLDAPGEGAVKREAEMQLRALLEGKTHE